MTVFLQYVTRFGDWGYVREIFVILCDVSSPPLKQVQLAAFNTIDVPVAISTTLPCAVCQLFYISRCWVVRPSIQTIYDDP